MNKFLQNRNKMRLILEGKTIFVYASPNVCGAEVLRDPHRGQY